jgi:hypothetical protein
VLKVSWFIFYSKHSRVLIAFDISYSFGGKHTGVALAKAVHGVMRKFDIENRVSINIYPYPRLS